MVEPISLGITLLSILVSEFAKSGFDALFAHVESRPTAPMSQAASAGQLSMSIVDLVSGAPATARASVHLSATTASIGPYWVLFGVHPAAGEPRVTPVLYGEPVELRVTRGQYGLSALFLTKPASFIEKPFLVAVGSAHEVLASSWVQQVAVSGSPPTKEQLEHLKAQVPAGNLPFRLPAARLALPPANLQPARSARWTPRLQPAKPALPPAKPQPAKPALPPAKPQPAKPAFLLAKPQPAKPALPPANLPALWASRLERAKSQPAKPAFPLAKPQPAKPALPPANLPALWASRLERAKSQPAKPAFPPAKPQPAKPASPVLWQRPTCQARDASGERCRQLPGATGQGRLCSRHIKEVLLGNYVLWDESGERVRWSLGGWS